MPAQVLRVHMNTSDRAEYDGRKHLNPRKSASSSVSASPLLQDTTGPHQPRELQPRYTEHSYGASAFPDPSQRTNPHWPPGYAPTGASGSTYATPLPSSSGSLPPAEPGSFRYPPRNEPVVIGTQNRDPAQRPVLLPPLQQAPPSRPWPHSGQPSPNPPGHGPYNAPYQTASVPWGRDVACKLRVRQQPQVARACGFGERDRRAVDPPPVLELEVDQQSASDVGDIEELNLSHYIVHACLYSEDGVTDVGTFLQQPRTAARRLVGSLAATPAVAADEFGHKGAYFTFADLSCREQGKFRIKFTLVRIDGATSPMLASVLSEAFRVFTPKDFPGMRQPTPLTNALKIQGVSIPAKKGRTTTVPKQQSRAPSDEEMKD